MYASALADSGQGRARGSMCKLVMIYPIAVPSGSAQILLETYKAPTRYGVEAEVV